MGVPVIADPPERVTSDPRLRPPRWSARADPRLRRRLAAMVALDVVLAVFYFHWLLAPDRVGFVGLYVLLLVAEGFNLLQAAGFWWTVLVARRYRPRPWRGPVPEVDVMIPVYGEPVEIVEPTVAAACRLEGATVRVHLLDDGDSPAMRSLAERHDVDYITRERHVGAKAGNINHALRRTDARYVLVLDCDHVPDRRFLLATLGHLQEERVAFVQTPQYYANADGNPVAAAAWSQQALFFGAIARGKDGLGAMFCAGTNVVFHRAALTHAGGFPEDSLTEDFLLSIRMHELGWRSRYVPEVLAQGLGPEDASSYVSQQQRWARGCLGGIGAALTARLPWVTRLQYLMASMYFLSGWTVLLYMSLPIIRIFGGVQPLAGATADQFLLHFTPYFGASLVTVALAGGGAYTWNAYTLQVASFWIHVRATLLAITRRRGRFVVTPKHGVGGPQPLAAWPPLAMLAVLLAAVGFGITRSDDPATLNNVCFAVLHIAVLLSGCWAAVLGTRRTAAARRRRAVRSPHGRALLIGAAAAGVAVLAGALIAVGTRPPTAGAPLTGGSAATQARAAGDAFLSHYEQPDGRVVRRDQGGDTVSEGQAYAMLVSVALGRRDRFRAAWDWTRANLERRDGLFVSDVKEGRILNREPASDADLDMATALALAAERFRDPRYAVLARGVAHDILAEEVISTSVGPTLSAGPWAVRARIVDPSYFSPTDFATMELVDPAQAGRWQAIAATARAELTRLTAGGALPTDWARAGADGRLSPIGSPSAPGSTPSYAFDAARVPIRYAAACDANDRQVAARLWPTLRRAGNPPPFSLTQTGSPLVSDSHPVSIMASAAAAEAAGRRTQASERVDEAGSFDRRFPTYYGAAWNALGRILLTTNWITGCHRAGAPATAGGRAR